MVAGLRNQSFFSVNHFRTLQPSEFVIFVAAEDVEDSSSYSEFNADAPQRRFTEAIA